MTDRQKPYHPDSDESRPIGLPDWFPLELRQFLSAAGVIESSQALAILERWLDSLEPVQGVPVGEDQPAGHEIPEVACDVERLRLLICGLRRECAEFIDEPQKPPATFIVGGLKPPEGDSHG